MNKGVLKISVPFSRWVEKGDLKIDWNAGRYSRHSSMPLQPLEHLTYFRRASVDALASQLGLTRVRLSAGDMLRYATNWTSPKSAIKNIGKALFRDRMRNYHLFQKLENTASGP